MQGAVLSASRIRAQAFCKVPKFQRSQGIWKIELLMTSSVDKLHLQGLKELMLKNQSQEIDISVFFCLEIFRKSQNGLDWKGP